MKSRVVTKLVARFKLARDPFGRRLLRDMTKLEDRRVGLTLHLLGVSAIDEQRRGALQHHRDSRPSRQIPSAICSRSALAGTYSFWCSSARGTMNPASPRFANSARNWLTRAAPCEGSPKATKD